MDKTRLNAIYHNMIKRCYCQKSKDYKWYGARGITVCKEWIENYKAFKEWAINSGYQDILTLDRIDVNKGYLPDNCRWVTIKAQLNNTRRNRYIKYDGRTQTMKQWCEELNLPYGTIKYRLNTLHWSVEKSFETKENPKLHKITYNGKTQPLRKWCAELNLPYNTIVERVTRSKWTPEKAFTTEIRSVKNCKKTKCKAHCC